MIDPDEYLRRLRAKLGLLEDEQSAIDLQLDDSEMVELLQVLQRIVSIGKKKVKKYDGLNEVVDL